MTQPKDDGDLERARAAKDRTTKLAARMKCVSGIGITKVRGRYAVKVSVSERGETGLPESVDGVPIVVEVVGDIRKQSPRTAKG